MDTGLQPWALVAVAGVALVALVIGALCRSQQMPAFAASNRNVSPALAGLATSAAFLTAAPFAGLAGTLYLLGSDGLAWIAGCGAGFVLMGTLIAPQFRASGAATVPGFLQLRFGPMAGRVAAVVVLLCCLSLMIAQLELVGRLAQDLLHVPRPFAIAGASGLVVAVLLPGGTRGATLAGAVLLAIVLIAYLVPLGLLAAHKHGIAFGPLGYGASLQDMQMLETDMIMAGFADARTLKPHVRPFLQFDHANTLALIVCLMAGTAVLPHVLMRNAVTAGVRQTRMAMAWALLATAAVLCAVPAYAAMAKHEVYSQIVKGVPLGEIGAPFDRFSQHDLVRVHGVSLALFDDVIAVVHAGAADTASVGKDLNARSPSAHAAWRELKPQVHGALLTAAKAPAGSATERWSQLRSAVFPVAALAAANKTGHLTHSGLTIAPEATALFGLALAGLSPAWQALFLGGALAAALAALAAAALAAGFALGSDLRLQAPDTPWPLRLGILAATVVAAAIVLVLDVDLAAAASWPFSLAAAGLFPALVLGIWWKRTTAIGAIAGMLAGSAVTATYVAGTTLLPVAMFEAAPGLSNASPMAAKRLGDLKTAAEKASDTTRAAAEAALHAHAGGNAVQAGVANWFGIHSVAAGLFGLPIGFATIVLVSLLTRRPTDDAAQHFESLHRPQKA